MAQRNDPYLNYNFLVEVDKLVVGGFSEVTGLQVEIQTEDYHEGGVNGYMHKLAGPARYNSNLILKRGITDAATLWEWQVDVVNGQVERKDISIILQDAAQNEKWRWVFYGAYPVKWSGPDMRAANAEVALETLEFAHNGFI